MYISLFEFFRENVIHVTFLQEYSKDPSGNWKSKDVAYYLVTSLAAKAQTQKVGTEIHIYTVNCLDF